MVLNCRRIRQQDKAIITLNPYCRLTLAVSLLKSSDDLRTNS